MECIFCGEDRRASTEHVIPVWAGPVLLQLPTTGANPGGMRMTHRFTPGKSDDAAPREWSTDGPSLTVKAVCVECNNHWLSRLEARASPIVGRLLLGHQTTLTTEEQRVVATWSYKTALLFQLVRPNTARPIPAARFRELYTLERPPADVRVWLGSPRGNNAMHEASTEINLAAERFAVPGFFTALALGRLLILCAGRFHPGPERLRVGSDVNPQITTQIWPASVRPAHWPPERPLNDLRPAALVELL